MCPRMKPRKQPDIQDKKELLPDLPKPKDLQPFPTILYLKYRGHNGKVQGYPLINSFHKITGEVSQCGSFRTMVGFGIGRRRSQSLGSKKP